MKSKAC